MPKAPRTELYLDHPQTLSTTIGVRHRQHRVYRPAPRVCMDDRNAAPDRQHA